MRITFVIESSNTVDYALGVVVYVIDTQPKEIGIREVFAYVLILPSCHCGRDSFLTGLTSKLFSEIDALM